MNLFINKSKWSPLIAINKMNERSYYYISPGNIKISSASTLNEAMLLAGDAKVIRGKVRFLRYLNNGEIDLRKIDINKSSTRGSYENPFLLDGDIIHVGRGTISTLSEVLKDITSPLQPIVNSYGFLKIINQ